MDCTLPFRAKAILSSCITILLFSYAATSQDNAFAQAYYGFIPNKGQIKNQNSQVNGEVTHLWASGKGMNVQLRRGGMSYDVYQIINADDSPPLYLTKNPKPKKFKFHRLDIELVGADKHALQTEHDQAPGELNFYSDIQSDKGVSASHYNRIVYEDIYDGVDLVCKLDEAGGRKFKYDFVLEADADISDIKIEYSGFDNVKFSEDELVFDLSGHSLTESIPASWYSPSGEFAKVSYKLISKTENSITVGLQLNSPVKNEGLVVDPTPVIHFAYYYGDTLTDYATCITADWKGDPYVAGSSQLLLSIATDSTHQTVFGGGTMDGFIIRRQTIGFHFWGTYLGGMGDDFINDIDCTDTTVFVVGNSTSFEGIATDSTAMPSAVGGTDAFVAQFDGNGQRLWASYLGGTGADTATSCMIDTIGNLYVAGSTNSPDLFSALSVSPQQTYSGGVDAFVAKFDTLGQVTWCTFFGGEQDDFGFDLYIDSLLNLYVCGMTNSTSGISTSGAHQESLAGDSDAFFVKYDSLGIQLWSTYFGGSETDVAQGVVSAHNNMYATGFTNSSDGIVGDVPDSLLTSFSGGDDVFLLSLDSLGALSWSNYIGDTAYDRASAIDRDLKGRIFIAGTTTSTYGISTLDAYQGNLKGASDIFIMKFDSLGTKEWGTYYGASDVEVGNDLKVCGNTVVFFAGHTNSQHAQYGTSAQDTVYRGNTDALFGKFVMTESTICLGIGGSYGGSGGGSGSGSGNGNDDVLNEIYLCLGDTITLFTVGGFCGSNSVWMWYENGCGPPAILADTGSVVHLSPDTTTTYFVRAEGFDDPGTGCVDITVYVVTAPETEISPVDTLCPGDSLQLFATGEGNFEWTGPNNFMSEEQNPVIDTLVPGDGGWYHLFLSNAPGCFDTDSVYLPLLDFPAYEFSSTPVSCWGEADGEISFTLPDSSGISYEWVDSTLTGNPLTGLAAGGYLLHLENEAGCFIEDSLFVEEPPTYVDTLLIDHTSCGADNGSATIHLLGNPEDFEIEWAVNGESDTVITELAAGIYEVFITDSTGCTETLVFEIEGSNPLNPQVASLTNASCFGNEDGWVYIYIAEATAPIYVQMADGEEFYFNYQAFHLSGLGAGEYELFITDSLGCQETVSFEIGQPDSISVEGLVINAYCGDDSGSISVTASGGNGIFEYYWPTLSDTTETVEGLTSGSYPVVVTASNTCSVTETFTVEDEGTLDIFVSPPQPQIDLGDTIALQVTTIPSPEPLIYLWEPANFLSCSDCPNPLAFPQETTTYQLTITTPDGCVNQYSFEVAVNVRCDEVFVPTIFSPNGDGKNDELFVYNECIIEMDFVVFNRWGQIVFESKDQEKGWDGTYRGEEVNSQYLVYSLSATLNDGRTINKSGNLRIHR